MPAGLTLAPGALGAEAVVAGDSPLTESDWTEARTGLRSTWAGYTAVRPHLAAASNTPEFFGAPNLYCSISIHGGPGTPFRISVAGVGTTTASSDNGGGEVTRYQGVFAG